MMAGLLPWLALMVAGLVASVVLLLWGCKSGQFDDQERARYLPLRGEETISSRRDRDRLTREVYALACLMAAAGCALAATLGVAVFR